MELFFWIITWTCMLHIFVTIFDFLAKRPEWGCWDFCGVTLGCCAIHWVLSCPFWGFFWVCFFLEGTMVMVLTLTLHWGNHELCFFLTSLCRHLWTCIWFAVSIYLKSLMMFCGPNHTLSALYTDYFETSLVVLLLSSFWERMEVVKIEALSGSVDHNWNPYVKCDELCSVVTDL